MNTKQNLHAEVQKGNTVITPNRLVENGTWRGIFYISAEQNGSALYAIGEQTQLNGGWTTGDLLQYLYVNETAQSRYGYLRELNAERFYAEDRYYDTVLCRITDVEYAAIISRPDWSTKYGMPCSIAGLKFGSINHAYIHASNAAHFYSPEKYDYWITSQKVKDKLISDKTSDTALTGVRLDGKFKFNPIVGTYMMQGHYDGHYDYEATECQKCITGYYQPSSNAIGYGRLVYGSILAKLEQPHYKRETYWCAPNDQWCGKENWVLAKMGFPTENRKVNTSNLKTTLSAQVQTFIGGEIHRVQQTFTKPKTYYIPQEIAAYYHVSTPDFGLPTNDPIFKNDGITLKQPFEIGHGITFNTTTGTLGIEYAAKYYCDEVNGEDAKTIAEAFIEGLYDTGTTEIQGALLFFGVVGVGGALIDTAVGTHGGATIVAVTYIGTQLTLFVSTLAASDKQDLFAQAEEWIAYEFDHSDCTARKTYLVSRYGSEVLTLIAGFKGGKKLSQLGVKTLQASKLEIETNKILTPLKNTFTNDIAQALKKLPDDPEVAKYVHQGEIYFTRYSDELAERTKNQLGSANIADLAKKAYHGAAYDDMVAEGLKGSADSKFQLGSIKHTILGDFDKTGTFTGGGLHDAKTVARKLDQGIIEVQKGDILGKGQKVTSLAEVPTDVNGVREVLIKTAKGNWEYKTLFPYKLSTNDPTGMTEQEIIDAIKEAAKYPVVVGENEFYKVVNIRDVALPVRGYYKTPVTDLTNVSSLQIRTAYPEIVAY